MTAVGAAAVGSVAIAGTAAATIDDALDTDTDDLQEALVTFESVDDVDRLGTLDLASGYHSYAELPIGYTELTGSQIEDVAGWDETLKVAANAELELEHDDARPDTNAREAQAGEGLEFPYTGENVHAAVIDTGVDGAHPDLEENLDGNYQWVGDPLEDDGDAVLWEDLEEVNTDDVGHGTHCLGSIGADGSASEGEYRGMAPDVTVTSYSANASLTLQKTVAAYDHIMQLQAEGERIHIASNSYGSGPGEFDPHDPLSVAQWYATEEGVLTTFSAGNDGPDNDTLGIRKQAPYVLSVAACHADQSVTDFSSRGDDDGNHDREAAYEHIVDLYSGVPEEEIDGPVALHRPAVGAKGADLMSTLNPVHPLWALGDDDETWYGLLSGTSMSNPVAAGCAALFIDAYVENHGEAPDPIETINALEATADAHALDDVDDPAGDEYTTANTGTGYVDALAAAQRAEDGDLADFDEVDLVDD